MPTYEYHCNACHREFEYQQKMSDADLVTCEACGEDKLERLISWTSVRSAPGVRKVHYTADKMEGLPKADSSRSQRFTGAKPAEPSDHASSGAKAAAPSADAKPAAPSADAKPAEPSGGAAAASDTGSSDETP